jgi:transcriptional regulator with XRE-family HTH domain
MSAGSDDTKRLREAVEARRLQLPGVPEWKELAASAGISTAALNKIRRGEPVRPATKAKAERALNWAPGSIDAILDGGAPTPVDERAPEDMDWTTIEPPEGDFRVIVGHWGELSDFTRQLVMKIAREARAEAERRDRRAGPRRDREA